MHVIVQPAFVSGAADAAVHPLVIGHHTVKDQINKFSSMILILSVHIIGQELNCCAAARAAAMPAQVLAQILHV